MTYNQLLEMREKTLQDLGVRGAAKAKGHSRLEAILRRLQTKLWWIKRLLVVLPPDLTPLDPIVAEREGGAQGPAPQIRVDRTHEQRYSSILEIPRLLAEQSSQCRNGKFGPRPL